MALLGFRRLQTIAGATPPGPATHRDAQNEAAVRQENLVVLMLEKGCDPRKTDGSGQTPIEMAARWGNERVVQKLLDANVFAPSSSCENSGRQLDACIRLASQSKSTTAFRVVLKFLRAGARVPTTADGRLTTDMVDMLKQSLTLLKPGTRMLYHSFLPEDARRFMDSGMRELLQLVLAKVPGQNVDSDVLGCFLIVAATAGDNASVELLLGHGASVDGTTGFSSISRDHTALGGAARFGHLDVMENLLDSGAKVKNDRAGNHTLTNAVIGGHAEAVKVLVGRGATLQRLNPLWRLFQELAVEYNHFETLEYLVAVEGRVDLPALATACARGKANFVTCLLSATRGTTPNPLESEGGPFYLACVHGHADIARWLIEHGANISEAATLGTPLIGAARRGHVDIVRLLLDLGADPNRQSSGTDSSSQSSIYEVCPT
jgi:ankyrin repeat protein